MEKQSMVFYRSWLDAIDEVEDVAEKVKCYEAIIRYGLDREEIQLPKGYASIIFKQAKPLIDKNHERYIHGIKGAESGVKGGAPKGNQNARKQPQNNPKTTPNVNVYDNDNVDDNVRKEGMSSTRARKEKQPKKQPRTIFTDGKPSTQELLDICNMAGIDGSIALEYQYYGSTPKDGDYEKALKMYAAGQLDKNGHGLCARVINLLLDGKPHTANELALIGVKYADSFINWLLTIYSGHIAIKKDGNQWILTDINLGRFKGLLGGR